MCTKENCTRCTARGPSHAGEQTRRHGHEDARSLRSGSIIDYRFRAEDSIDRAVLDEIEYEYLYNDGEGYHFMDTANFEQMQLGAEVLGDAVYYLIPNIVLKLVFYEGKPMGAILPDTVDLTVTDTEPTVQ